MPSLIDIRRRIRSVKNTQQITRAMKMVSAAKLRRAQERVLQARPYGDIMRRMLANVAQAAAEDPDAAENPLLTRRPERRILFLVITGDRGLAGAFNSSIIKEAQKFIADHPDAEIDLELMGRKGRDFFRKRHPRVSGEYSTLFQKAVRQEDSREIAKKVIERFSSAENDAVYMVFNKFGTILSPVLTLTRLLPIELPEKTERIEYIFEQPPKQLLGALLPRYVEVQIFSAMIESAAAEHAARMTAMDAASSNAGDVIDRLTLNMNRVRQASITKEIIEIVSGAAALE